MSSEEFEDTLLRILEKRPVSVDAISFITGHPTNHILMKLSRMKKWKLVEVVTTKEVKFWGLSRAKRREAPTKPVKAE